ncbi:mechanosensitive ion channel family protein [Shewanella maritima]|uniref:Small-conductance mechanosensitive channel n=2 Tax=Shewanella maritima TaxID=2520507 RepID=A0A411PMZ1_9GAMM|nr:mechanosensitive ion channel family protein [Shewanella maritima]
MRKLFVNWVFIFTIGYTSVTCANTASSITPNPNHDTELISQNIALLQSMIHKDMLILKSVHGEMRDFTEYRIKNKSELLRQQISNLIQIKPLDKKELTPLIEHQLRFITNVERYIQSHIDKLYGQVESDIDEDIFNALISRQSQLDYFLKAQLETLKLAELVDIDTREEQAKFVKKLLLRADRLDSLANYNYERLKLATKIVAKAGKDATDEQKERVLTLKRQLNQSSTSLEGMANLLESVQHDATQFRQTFINVSGDITEDVLDMHLVSSLIKQWGGTLVDLAKAHGPNLLFKTCIFILILFFAGLVGKLVNRIVAQAVRASNLNFSRLLQDFFISLSSKAIYALGLLIALSQLGFELGPLLAGFGIAGVIVGFALQDTLSNFASGMMILIYRPYDVGDLINAAGVTGKVSHMSLVSTTIKTLDNQRLIIPNNKIWGDTINNITAERLRRVDMVFSISYSDNIEHAEQVLKDILSNHELICREPEPMIKLHTLNSSSVDFIVRPWAKPIDYWEVYWDITRTVKLRFDEEGIRIPFPQRDLHIY